MARGTVNVNNLNLTQGTTPDVERKLLFMGAATSNVGNVLSITQDSDLDELLGENDSVLKTNIIAARTNGGQNWFAWMLAMNDADTHEDYLLAFSEVMDTYFTATSPEGLVVLHEATVADELKDWQAAMMALLGATGRQMFTICATQGVGAETWSDYEAAQQNLVASVAAARITAVPQLHGNDCGVLAGRLCNKSVSIADSPMRVASGPVLGLGNTPTDSAGVELPEATLVALDAARLSTIQHYPDYPGTYWADANTLDALGGDYQILEYLRPVLKACRAVRVLAIARIADRNFNDTPQSIAYHRGYFARPLREMSKSTQVDVGSLKLTVVGDIQPPEPGAVNITWQDTTSVKLFIVVKPYNSPKSIEANVVLDLSAGE